MLILDNAAAFNHALKRLNNFQTGLTPASANSHLWVEQVGERLKLVAHTLEHSWTTQWIDSPSTVDGVRFLISCVEVPRILKVLDNKLGLVVRAAEGGATISSVSGFRDNGEPIELDTILARTYYGDSAEYGPIETVDDPCHAIRLRAADYLAAITLLKDFGTYSKDQASCRLLLMSYRAADGVLEFYGSQDKNPNFFCRFQIFGESSAEEDFQFIFKGRLLEQLTHVCQAHDSEVQLKFDFTDSYNPKLEVVGDIGSVYLHGEAAENCSYVTGPTHFFRSGQELPLVGFRTFSLKRMEKALGAQEPDRNSATRQIKIEAHQEHLVLSKAQDYKCLEYSLVVNEYPEALGTPFPALRYNVEALQKCVGFFNSYRVRYKLDTDHVVHYIQKQALRDSERWLVKLIPFEPQPNGRATCQIIGIVEPVPQPSF